MPIPEAALKEIDAQLSSGNLSRSRISPEYLAEYDAWKTPTDAAPSPTGQSRPRGSNASELLGAFNVGVENLGAQAVGAVEAAMTMASGMPAQILSGYAGIRAGIQAPRGEKLSAAVEAINNVSGTFTFQPRTQAGKSQLQGAAALMSPIMDGINKVSEVAADQTGSPAIGAGVKTLMEVGPMFFGVKNPIRATQTNLAVARESNRILRQAGIDPSLPMAEQLARVPEAAALLANNAKETALNFSSIQEGVKRQYGNVRTMVRSMYDEAKTAGTVGVDVNQVKVLDGAIADSLAGYDPATIAPMNGLLKDFSRLTGGDGRGSRDVKLDPVPGRRLGGLPDKAERIAARNEWRSKVAKTRETKDSVIELNDIADFRGRVSKLSRSSDRVVAGAAESVKYHIDEWFNAQLANDLVSGSADAITKWKSATSAYKQMFEGFRVEPAIKSLIDKEATPEQIKSWIYGASAAGAKPQAGLVVAKLKNILGDDAPEIASLKQGVMFDVVRPLLDETFSVEAAAAFSKNFAKLRADKPTLWKNLFSPEEMASLDSLNRVVTAARNVDRPQALVRDVNQAIAVILFPKAHPIRAGKVTLDFIDGIVGRVRSVVGTSTKQQYLEQLSGLSMEKHRLSAQTPALASVVQTIDDEESASISEMIRNLSGR